MKNLGVYLCATCLTVGVAGVADASVWVPGVTAASGWHDADKTMVDDTLMCWAAATSNALAYTEWYGWDGALISTADDIFSHYKGDWPDATGSALYATEWWFTDHAVSAYDGTVFPTPGNDFYPGVTWYPSGVYGWSGNPGNFQDHIPNLHWYITDPTVARGLVINIESPLYSHSVSVWGMEPPVGNLATDPGQLYITDSDDGLDALKTVNYSKHADNYWYIDQYLPGVDFKIIELHRVNLNVDGIEPNPGGPDEVIPEPGTFAVWFLIGSSVGTVCWRQRRKTYKT